MSLIQMHFLKMLLVGSSYSPPGMAPVQSGMCAGDVLRVLHLVYSGNFFYPLMKLICFSLQIFRRVIVAASALLDLGSPGVYSGYQ